MFSFPPKLICNCMYFILNAGLYIHAYKNTCKDNNKSIPKFKRLVLLRTGEMSTVILCSQILMEMKNSN